MCIPVPTSCFYPDLFAYSSSFQKEFLLYLKKMSLQKKNVIQGFMRDEHVPLPEQFLVKYCSGKGNNLHEVECFDGARLLVSMPKKYRQTVWLKKNDCLVIDPIEEGKKVKGEIVCLLPDHAVRDLITSCQYPTSTPADKDALLKFFDRNSDLKAKREEFDPFPSSDSSDVETDDEETVHESAEGDQVDEEDQEDEDETENSSESNISLDKEKEKDEQPESIQSNYNGEDVDDVTRDRNRSRVQLVTSGIVTVTNVLSEGFENDIQSLEFEADEEEYCDDDTAASNNRDIHRHANTIRIQVNYDNAN